MFKKFLLEIALCSGLIGISMGSENANNCELYFEGEQGKSEFEKMSAREIEKATSITFESMKIDYNFVQHFSSYMPQYVCDLSFKNCELDGTLRFCDMLTSSNSVQNLSIINCGLFAFDASVVINSIDHDALSSVDFSCNEGLGNDSSLNNLVDYFKTFWGISILY